MADSEPCQTLPDADLLARARGGDEAAAAELYARYRAPLIRFCHRYLGRADAAEDAAHDVLVRITVEQRWPDRSFRAWVYRAARNRCYNERQRPANRDVALGGTHYGESRFASPRTGPRTAADRNERQVALQSALAELAPDLSEVLAMRYFDELSRQEMASVLGIGEGVVKQRLVQARAELERKLNGSSGR